MRHLPGEAAVGEGVDREFHVDGLGRLLLALRLRERLGLGLYAAEEDPDAPASAYLNWPIHLFFIGKFLLLGTGYILLAKYLAHAIAVTAA